MARRTIGWGMAAALVALASASRSAVAQVGAPAANPFTNPVTNPYLNPYLNPYVNPSVMGRDGALLYFLSAQQASGGIGSGMLSGLRAPAAAASRPAAEMPRSVMAPGGGAARYFQRGPAGGRPAYFQRPNRYFDHNGREPPT